MNHTSEELFSVFFSTVFESSCISDFTQKMASFFKRYMPVSAVYISFFEKDTIFKVAEYADYSKNPFPDQITIPEDTLRRMYIEDNFFTGDVHSIKNFTGEETCVFSEFSILLYNDMNALKHSFIAERHPSANKNIKEKYELSSSGDAFPTLDTIIIDHIKMAIAKANGKIAGPDGAANLLGLNTSTLWSKIRKYNIDPKTLTE